MGVTLGSYQQQKQKKESILKVKTAIILKFFSLYTKHITCDTGVGTVLNRVPKHTREIFPAQLFHFLIKCRLDKRMSFQCLQGPDSAVNLTCSNGQAVSCSFTRSNLTFSHWPGVTLLCRRGSSHIISVLHNLLKVCNEMLVFSWADKREEGAQWTMAGLPWNDRNHWHTFQIALSILLKHCSPALK